MFVWSGPMASLATEIKKLNYVIHIWTKSPLKWGVYISEVQNKIYHLTQHQLLSLETYSVTVAKLDKMSLEIGVWNLKVVPIIDKRWSSHWHQEWIQDSEKTPEYADETNTQIHASLGWFKVELTLILVQNGLILLENFYI